MCCEHYTDVHHPFIDFQAAFDTVWRKETWSEMYTLGTPPPTFQLCRNLNNEIYVKVKICKHLYSEFKANKGVRQGDAIAPVLINVVLANCNLKI